MCKNKKTMMDVVTSQQIKPVSHQPQTNIDELVERIAGTVREDGMVEPLNGLYFHRASSSKEPLHSVSEPAFCLIAQGSKEIFLANERYQYDPAHYLLVTAELPTVGHVLEASKEKPYLSLRLKLEPTLVGSVMVETRHLSQNQTDVRAINISSLDANLLDAVLRLIRLLDSPSEASFLAPLIMREIIYRLLMGEQGEQLRHIAVLGGQSHRIVRAIEQIRKDFDQALKIESMARDLGMSVSGFHHHFKSVTAMSPLQFQKRLRLQEARRLMLGEYLDAASAAYRVGYDDASHFNREYKRLFGLPPMRDVERLREVARESVSLEPTFLYGEENAEHPLGSPYAATDEYTAARGQGKGMT
jgi:AraC-like DNA-binding protein